MLSPWNHFQHRSLFSFLVTKHAQRYRLGRNPVKGLLPSDMTCTTVKNARTSSFSNIVNTRPSWMPSTIASPFFTVHESCSPLRQSKAQQTTNVHIPARYGEATKHQRNDVEDNQTVFVATASGRGEKGARIGVQGVCPSILLALAVSSLAMHLGWDGAPSLLLTEPTVEQFALSPRFGAAILCRSPIADTLPLPFGLCCSKIPRFCDTCLIFSTPGQTKCLCLSFKSSGRNVNPS